MLYDVFICHASEDKNSFVRPLAEILKKSNLEVWYDEFSLTIGDSLRESIDKGLSKSRFGIVVLSPSFFKKKWPQRELNGLVAREMSGEDRIILPIWHNITNNEILKYSPTCLDCNANALGKRSK
ncbi:toll/interleukin-1 receptor domain-containing protein [Candidatus Desantisbacteria bacterium]|nr:toll/interleukin-1 receptor domain-containing protein [Candidatus Desantisbacteria bacterium]